MKKENNKINILKSQGMEVHERVCGIDLWERVTKKDELLEDPTDNQTISMTYKS